MTDPVQPIIVRLRNVRRVRIDRSEQVVSARASDVLAYLHSNAGRVVTKAELLEHVWADLNVEESNLTVQIAALSKLIGERAIATVPGVGYQLTLAGRCCGTLSTEDALWESRRLDGVHEQDITRPLPHDELVKLYCSASQTWLVADLARQGVDLARVA